MPETAIPWRSRIVGSGSEPPEQLLANPANWRTHPGFQRDALRGSLNEVGWVQQVMVNRTTGHVVDGHARIEEAISRGEPSVPVLYVELELEEEAVVLATLDPIAALAIPDDAKLRELIGEISVDDEALRRLLADLSPTAPKAGRTDPDEAPPLGDGSNIHAGDLFGLGEHRLLCGDAADPEALARLMNTKADCIWTDPPYGVAYVGKTKDRLTLDNDDESSAALVRSFFSAALGLAADRAPFYCAGPAGQRLFDIPQAIVDAGWTIYQELIWVKDVFVLGYSDYHFQHEPLFFGYAPGPGRPGRGAHEGSRWYGGHDQSSVLAFDRPKRSTEHPTMKPEALVERCLLNSTKLADSVLDPFAGSGSTIIASERLGRRCYAMDIDPRYIAVAIERWENFTGRKAERVE